MQTMPGFLYLIPAVAFFGIGMVPGVFASVIFALPPTVRMTNLGIRSISKISRDIRFIWINFLAKIVQT